VSGPLHGAPPVGVWREAVALVLSRDRQVAGICAGTHAGAPPVGVWREAVALVLSRDRQVAGICAGTHARHPGRGTCATSRERPSERPAFRLACGVRVGLWAARLEAAPGAAYNAAAKILRRR